MAQSRDEFTPSRIELVVLACLSQSKPPNDAELGEAVLQLASRKESADSARRRAVELLVGLVRRGWVTGDESPFTHSGRRKAQAPRKLTDSGARALRAGFQLTRTPTWAQVRDKHFPAMAIGVQPGSEITEKACTERGLMMAVLGTRFGARDARTPVQACDAVIARALGMPPGKLTLKRMREHVISRGVDLQAKDAPSRDSKSYWTKLGAWVACSAVGATGTERKLARALARRWVCEDPYPMGARLVTDRDPRQAMLVTTVSVPPPPLDTSPVPADDGGTSGVDTTVAGADTRAAAQGSGGHTFTSNEVRRPAATDTHGSQLPLPHTTSEVKGIVVERNAPLAPKNLLEAVRDAIARIGAEGRFGEKVYVSAIWRTMERERKVSGLSLDHFKRWLVNANRDHLWY